MIASTTTMAAMNPAVRVHCAAPPPLSVAAEPGAAGVTGATGPSVTVTPVLEPDAFSAGSGR